MEEGARVCEPEADGSDGLEHEVWGKDGFLERGELCAGEGAVGGYPTDEGLEEGGAEEGAIAGEGS